MQFFWRRQLSLLILIQLLEHCRLSHELHAEPLLAFKSTFGSSQQFVSRIGRPFTRQWDCLNNRKLRDLHVGPAGFLSRDSRTATTVNGDTDVPTLTPVQASDIKKPGKQKVAAIVGGVGAALLAVIMVVLVYYCLVRLKRFIRRTSESASSAPSPPVELEREYKSPAARALPAHSAQHPRELTIMELEHATGIFSQSSIIGEGAFGLVYKGLLEDGSVVAVKRCLSYPIQFFVREIKRIACVRHKHLVNLIGYCEANYEYLLVYDYISNGNIGNHLYDNEGLPLGKLQMRKRLSVALGAAKGLEHLHSLVPPFLHLHFRTRNILVDENFTAKVSDFGLSRLLLEWNSVETSSSFDCFLDPELMASREFSERNDVYSFGVFLLELISGREAICRNQSDMQQNLVLRTVKQMMRLALLCVGDGLRRPTMRHIVGELERIQHRDVGNLHSDINEEIGNVTLGSELFK